MRRTAPARLLAVFLLVCAFGLAGCSDDEPESTGGSDTSADSGDESPDGGESEASPEEDSEREKDAANALTADFASGSDADFPLSAEQASCFGQGLVDTLGVDALIEAKALTEDLEVRDSDDTAFPPDQAAQAAEVMVGCTGPEPFVQAVLSEAKDAPASARRCVKREMDEAALTQIFTPYFAGDQDKAESLLSAVVGKCAPK
jgi:hypothetical protein